MTAAFTARLVDRPGCHVLRLVLIGELDLAAVDELRLAFAAIAASDPRSLLIDCGGLTFIDCAGLGTLLEVSGRPHDRLVAIPNHMRRLLRALGLDDRLGRPTVAGTAPATAEPPIDRWLGRFVTAGSMAARAEVCAGSVP